MGKHLDLSTVCHPSASCRCTSLDLPVSLIRSKYFCCLPVPGTDVSKNRPGSGNSTRKSLSGIRFSGFLRLLSLSGFFQSVSVSPLSTAHLIFPCQFQNGAFCCCCCCHYCHCLLSLLSLFVEIGVLVSVVTAIRCIMHTCVCILTDPTRTRYRSRASLHAPYSSAKTNLQLLLNWTIWSFPATTTLSPPTVVDKCCLENNRLLHEGSAFSGVEKLRRET